MLTPNVHPVTAPNTNRQGGASLKNLWAETNAKKVIKKGWDAVVLQEDSLDIDPVPIPNPKYPLLQPWNGPHASILSILTLT